MMNYSLAPLALMLALTGACADAVSPEVSGEDLERMKRASRAYVEGWRANDPQAVMAAFVAEPVLSPFRLPFIEGQQAAREFWWPRDARPAMVKAFEYDEREARGSGDLGYVRGTFTLGFEYSGTTYTSRGTYLHILTRTPEGWRISHRFWNDLARDPD